MKIVKSITSSYLSVYSQDKEISICTSEKFHLLKSSESGIEMIVTGKNEGDKYRVNDHINMVYRKIHGTIIEIFVEEFLDTGIGSLSKKYTSQQIDPDTLKANRQKLEYEDEFINIEKSDFWILNSRTIKYLNQNQKKKYKVCFRRLYLINNLLFNQSRYLSSNF